MAANRTVYLFYNVYGNDPSILYRVLNEKKRLNTKERKTTLLLRNTAFKLLHLKDQQKGLTQQADKLFNYKFNIITEEECKA